MEKRAQKELSEKII